MNFQNTKVFILLDPPEMEEEYLLYSCTFTKNFDYIAKFKINIMTPYIYIYRLSFC